MNEVTDDHAIKLISSILANQIALDFNEDIKFSTIYKHELKRKLGLANKELIKAEGKDFDPLVEGTTVGFTDFVHNIQYSMIKMIASLGIYAFEDILILLKAYQKNKKSIMGIANKINQS